MQIHYVNTETGLFVHPTDVEVPSAHHPVIDCGDRIVLHFCFLDSNGDPYTLTDRSTFSFSVSYDGAIVLHADGNSVRPVDPLNGRVDVYFEKSQGFETGDGTGIISAIIDGHQVLSDAVLFSRGESVVLPTSTQENKTDTIRALVQYEEPSADNLGEIVIYFGPEGLMTPGYVYRCILSEGLYSWMSLTPDFVSTWRWYEYV